ncbi:MAG: SIMPL domain-containing protein [Burkholderiaceae bacterium]
MRSLFVFIALGLTSAVAFGQSAVPAAPRGEGTVVVMPGNAEVQLANDEATASFYAEVQDADAVRAQSLVNQRVAEGTALLKRADPSAKLESSGYQTYPIYTYPKDAAPKLVAWRVRQTVQLRTGDLNGLSRTVQAAQAQLALGGVQFRLSRAARDKAEAQLIERAIANVNARVAAAAGALSVPPARVRIEELSFGVRGEPMPPSPQFMRAAAAPAADTMATPSFEPGQTTETLGVTARVRFLP